MHPYCDSLDGAVVNAARRALESNNVAIVLPYVAVTDEQAVRDAFIATSAARAQGGAARDVADRYFFETVVRIHRTAEGAPYTGLQPAGFDPGPVIPIAERAMLTGSCSALITLLSGNVQREAERRFAEVMRLQSASGDGSGPAREYVEAMLGFQAWAHHLYVYARSGDSE